MNEEIIKEFIKFLKKNRAYSKFKKNLKNINEDEKTRNIDTYLSITTPYNYLWSAFDWSKTPEGTGYWVNLKDQWEVIIMNNGLKGD